MDYRQRDVIGVAVLIVSIVLGAAMLRSGGDGGERIATDAGILARAGVTSEETPAPVVAGLPLTPTTSTGAPAPAPTPTLRRPATTSAPAATRAVPTTTTAGPLLTTATTAAAPASTTTTAVVPATTTTTAVPATTSTTAVPATTSTTAVPATTTSLDPCRNSSDSACGPFRFDPQPGADSPMTVQVTVAPGSPVAGQPMEFHITLSDPDGVSYDGTVFNFGNSGVGGSTPDTCARFGPWDPPARDPASATQTLTVTHTYFEAGTFTATFAFDAGPFDCVDSVTGRGDRPYASSATGTVTVVVSPVA